MCHLRQPCGGGSCLGVGGGVSLCADLVFACSCLLMCTSFFIHLSPSSPACFFAIQVVWYCANSQPNTCIRSEPTSADLGKNHVDKQCSPACILLACNQQKSHIMQVIYSEIIHLQQSIPTHSIISAHESSPRNDIADCDVFLQKLPAPPPPSFAERLAFHPAPDSLVT